MADGKKSFLLYCDIQSTINKLSDDNAGKLFKIILGYVNDQNPAVDDILLDLVFEPIKLQLKRDLKRYESIVEKRSASGRIGGLKSGESRSKQQQNEANEASALKSKQNEANEAVTDTVTDTVTDIEKKNIENANKLAARSTGFQKGLIPFIKLYPKEMVRAFADYWTEPNIPKTKMKFELERTWDVEKRLKTWANRENKFNKPNENPEPKSNYKNI